MRRTRIGFGATIGIAILLVLTACGGGAEPTATPLPQATPTATRAAAPTASAAAPTAPTATPRPTATAAPQPTATPRGPEGTLNIAVDSLGTELFVTRLVSSAEVGLGHMISDGMLAQHPITLQPEGRWVSEWSYQKIGADNIWSFNVRPGVVINEGWGAVTVEDVKFNFAELLKPDTRPGEIAGAIRTIIDNDLNNFEIASPLGFRTHSSRFNVTTIETLIYGVRAGWPFQPKAYSEKVGDDGYSAHPVGTGSFVLKSAQKGSKYTVEAVPNHWRRTASVRTVNLLIVPEEATRVAMLKTRQAEIAPLSGRFKAELSGDLRPYSFPKQSQAFVTLGGMYYDRPDKNCTTCPWVGYDANAVKVRTALSVAIDRQAILDRLLYSEGELSVAPFAFWPPGPYAHVDPAWKPPPYDPTLARRLLAEAGYPSGFGITMVMFELGGLPGLPDFAEAVAGYWEKIGIKVTRRSIEYAPTFRGMREKRDTKDMAYVLYFSPVGEVLTRITTFTKAGTSNYLEDPKVEEFVKQASVEPDPAKRAALGRALGQYFIDMQLGAPLFTVNGVWGVSSRVASWDNQQGGQFYLNRVETITLRP